MTLTRRHALLTGATLPLAGLVPAASHAQEQLTVRPEARFKRIQLGAFEVTVLLAGSQISKPEGTFGLNATPEDFAALSQENFIPADQGVSYYNPVLVGAGSDLILFDTGADPAGITSALAEAGFSPDQITGIVITHMHGDHIGGISDGTTATFPNAKLITGRVEMEAWLASGGEAFDAKIRPIADSFTLIAGGDEVVSGITAVEAFGHTPGMLAFRLESDGAELMLTADVANHYVWSLARPEWEVRFDMDKPTAITTRLEVLGMLADERIPFIGYHMPFPAVGFVARDGDYFRFMPATYQFALG